MRVIHYSLGTGHSSVNTLMSHCQLSNTGPCLSDTAPMLQETMRGCLAGMFVNDRFQRPTYERDAEDDEFATANGLSMPKFDQQRRDLPQARPNAGRFGTMAFAMPPAAEEVR